MLKALKKLKEIKIEFLNWGGEVMFKWLRRLFNVYLNNMKLKKTGCYLI